MLHRLPALVLVLMMWSGSVLAQEVDQNTSATFSEANSLLPSNDFSPAAKDPGTATLIAVLVPGGGHMYSGETSRGLLLFGVGVGGIIVGTAATLSSSSISCGQFSCSDDTNYLPVMLGYGAYLGSWIYGIIDASNSAHRMNAARGIANLRSIPQPIVQQRNEGRVALGLQLAF